MLKRFITTPLKYTQTRYMSVVPNPTVITSKSPGPIEAEIVQKLSDKFSPTFLKVANDSHKHAHHAGIRGASNVTESHFRIEIVSGEFTGKNMPTRHRLIYQTLDEELKVKGVHALQLKTKTDEEVKK